MLLFSGPSGSGKTSLMDVLAGREKNGTVTGTLAVQFQGKPRSRMNVTSDTAKQFHSASAYVMQDDAFLGNLTVRETIEYALALKKPKEILKMTREEKTRLVEDIVETLNLSKSIDTLVGTPLKRGISGGERRRLSIAVEMVTDPRLIFLDEPVRGQNLDQRKAQHSSIR
jgi:ABC-type multidrug transport system ATPase subunit